MVKEHRSKGVSMTAYMRRHGCKFIDIAHDFKKLSTRYEQCKRRVESERAGAGGGGGGGGRPKRPRATSQTERTLGAENLIHLSEGGRGRSVRGAADDEWLKIVTNAFQEVYGTKKRRTK